MSWSKPIDRCVKRNLRSIVGIVASILVSASFLSAQMNSGENSLDAGISTNPAMAPIQDQPGLPRVLLIGDSVSIGYTVGVQQLLAGKANVHRIPMNGTGSTNGEKKLQEWLNGEKWDVIHVNFGLHDAKLPPEGVLHTDLGTYESNLREIIKQLKSTGAKIIWATTTPVPDGGNLSPTRRIGPIADYNKVAIRVMQENNVAIDDLYSVVLPVQAEIQRPHDVHFTKEGYKLLAKAVAKSIEADLPQNRAITAEYKPVAAKAVPAASEHEHTPIVTTTSSVVAGRGEDNLDPDYAAAMDFMQMNVCVDPNGRITAQNPLNMNPSAPKCLRQRNLRPGESIPYYVETWGGHESTRRYTFLSETAGTDQNGNKYPIIIGWADRKAYGKWDSSDGISVWTIQDHYASGMGSTGGENLSVNLGPGAQNPANKGITRFNQAWIFFPISLTRKNGVHYGVFGEQIVNTPREKFTAVNLPAAPELHSYFSIESHQDFGFGPKSSIHLDAMIGNKYAGKDRAGLSPGTAKAMERSYFTRELGETRWEAWKRDDSEIKDLTSKAHQIYASGACGLPATLAESKINPHFEIGNAQVVPTEHGDVYGQVVYAWDDKSQQMVKHTWYLVHCADWSKVGSQTPLNLNSTVEGKQNTLLHELFTAFVAQ